MIHHADSRFLIDLAASYFLARNLAPNSQYQLSRSIACFGQHLGRQATIDDLTGDTVSKWLESLEQRLARRTVAGHRTNVMSLWRHLAEQGLVQAPRQVRRVVKPDPCPVAWTIEELRALIAQAEKIQWTMADGTPMSIYFLSTIYFCYETGLRRSDAWLVSLSQIREDGSIQMRQHKTGRTHQPRITQRTLALMKQIKHDPPLAWVGGNPRQWYVHWNLLVAAARIRPGALQQIRRTGATHLYREHPEDVQRYLGHRTPTMQKHYVDLSLAAPQVNMPPEL